MTKSADCHSPLDGDHARALSSPFRDRHDRSTTCRRSCGPAGSPAERDGRPSCSGPREGRLPRAGSGDRDRSMASTGERPGERRPGEPRLRDRAEHDRGPLAESIRRPPTDRSSLLSNGKREGVGLDRPWGPPVVGEAHTMFLHGKKVGPGGDQAPPFRGMDDLLGQLAGGRITWSMTWMTLLDAITSGVTTLALSFR